MPSLHVSKIFLKHIFSVLTHLNDGSKQSVSNQNQKYFTVTTSGEFDSERSLTDYCLKIYSCIITLSYDIDAFPSPKSSTQNLKETWDKLHHEYQALPLIIDTASQRAIKDRLERGMKQLEDDIGLFERFKIIHIPKDN